MRAVPCNQVFHIAYWQHHTMTGAGSTPPGTTDNRGSFGSALYCCAHTFHLYFPTGAFWLRPATVY
eukprot:scaffold3540_cov379-Prasinococcus_capsulatus_cf.AAC.7